MCLVHPGTLHYYLINDSSVRLFWDPPTVYNVSVDFLHYKIMYVLFVTNHTFIWITRSVHTEVNKETVIPWEANSYTHSNLHSSTLYSFQIAAVYLSYTCVSNLVHIQTSNCTNEVCLNGGTCTDFSLCACMVSYTGDHCESMFLCDYQLLTYGYMVSVESASCDPHRGFNDTNCQPCPENSFNVRGYFNESCTCVVGYTGSDGEPCVGKLIGGMCISKIMNW